MTRTVERCPECGATTWAARVGAGVDPAERYRCECGATFAELEESETENSGQATHGLARNLEQLADEHDGDVPIPGGSA
jgi:transposase-like protein